MRTLYLKVDFGIGNRIAPIFFAARLLALGHFDKVQVWWQQSVCSQFEFSDLFDVHDERLSFTAQRPDVTAPLINVKSFNGKLDGIQWWRYLPTANELFCYGLAPVLHVSDAKTPRNAIIKEVNESWPKFFSIKQELLDAVPPTTAQHVGLHCRRTDSDSIWISGLSERQRQTANHNYARALDEAMLPKLKITANRPIYVASDDPITQRRYVEWFGPERTSHLALENPIKMLCDMESPPPITTNWSMTERTVKSIKESFVDLLALSRCGIVVSDFPLSSFAAMAEFLTGVQVKFLRRPIFIKRQISNKKPQSI